MTAVQRAAAGRWSWIDLRLVPVAAGVWALTLVAPHLPAAALVLVGGGAVVVALLLRRRPGAGVTVALAVLAGLVVTSAAGAVRTSAREGSPLRGPALDERVVQVRLRLDGAPRVLGGGAAEPRVVADATVVALERPEATAADAAVLLFAPARGWDGLVAGTEVRVRAAASEPAAGDDAVAVLSARGPPELVGGPGAWQRVAADLRTALAASASRTMAPRPAGLLPGLVVGDTSGLDPALETDFERAGLAHLTAVSGANVAIVLAAVVWPLRRRAVDRRVQAVVALLGLGAFVGLAGPEPSVLRAAAMGAVTLLALATGRVRAAVPALAAAVVVLLLVEPRLAREPGFALSVVATAAIVLLAPGWSRSLRLRGWPTPVADAIAVSAAAGMATAPLVAALSGTVSLVALPANLLAAPAVPPATVLGLLGTAVVAVLPPLGDALVRAAGWPTRWLVLVAERAAGLPDATAAWPAGVRGAAVLTVLLLGAGWALWRYRRLRVLAVAVLAGVVLVGWPVRQGVRGWPPPSTLLVACDVGQGDALVLPTAAGEAVLVDAGPDVAAVDRCLDRLGVDRLPLVLLSHLDADHVAGLAGALAGRDVGTVATGTLSPADDRASELVATLRGTGARREVLVPGDRRQVGGVGLEVLAPAPERATAGAEPNDLSLVVRATMSGVRVLLTGDLGAEAEARLERSDLDLSADVLKVPHHGSADFDAGFLAATGARVALVSVGADNTYGHPAPSLLAALTRDGVRVHRTDREGDVAVSGTRRSWGIAVRGRWRRASRGRRYRVTPCRGACRCCRAAHVAAARRPRRGGAAEVARGLRGAVRRPRPPPRRRAARTGRPGPAGGAAGRRAGPLAVRRSPAGGRRRRARGRRRARRRAHRLRQGPRPRHHARARARRWEAERGPGQGLHHRRGRRRRVPEDQLRRRPHGLRAQRGPDLRRADHRRRGERARRGGRQRPPGALRSRRPAGVGLRRLHRRRRRRPVPPRAGRGHRVHRRRAGAGRRPAGLPGDAALGAAARCRARAHRRCDRRRRPDRRPRELAELHQPRRAGPHAQDAALEGQEGPVPVARLEHRRAAAGHAGDRRAQRRCEGRRGERGLRPRARRAPHRRHPRRDGPRPGRRPLTPGTPGTRTSPRSRLGQGARSTTAPRGRGGRIRDRRSASPDPTCGWRPGSCG
ncbi:ComEC/Rec2 family competence protein [Blastococcus sp. TF02A-30]|nr:ComEC/Rec2 family competence protein [Blastococcus sp. TF02A-30]